MKIQSFPQVADVHIIKSHIFLKFEMLVYALCIYYYLRPSIKIMLVDTCKTVP